PGAGLYPDLPAAGRLPHLPPIPPRGRDRAGVAGDRAARLHRAARVPLGLVLTSPLSRRGRTGDEVGPCRAMVAHFQGGLLAAAIMIDLIEAHHSRLAGPFGREFRVDQE